MRLFVVAKISTYSFASVPIRTVPFASTLNPLVNAPPELKCPNCTGRFASLVPLALPICIADAVAFMHNDWNDVPLV
jgi:hypothetical protein